MAHTYAGVEAEMVPGGVGCEGEHGLHSWLEHEPRTDGYHINVLECILDEIRSHLGDAAESAMRGLRNRAVIRGPEDGSGLQTQEHWYELARAVNRQRMLAFVNDPIGSEPLRGLEGNIVASCLWLRVFRPELSALALRHLIRMRVEHNELAKGGAVTLPVMGVKPMPLPAVVAFGKRKADFDPFGGVASPELQKAWVEAGQAQVDAGVLDIAPLPTGPFIAAHDAVELPKDMQSKSAKAAYDRLHTGMALPKLPASIPDALEREFPWCGAAVDRIRRDMALAQRLGGGCYHLPPLLLVGPAGCGKSRFAARLQQLSHEGGGPAGLTFQAGGNSDSRTMLGTSRGYGGSVPSLPVSTMASSGQGNPILVVEEIDKACDDSKNGSMREALLPMLERGTASTFLDECLAQHVDLSRLTWVFTANRRDKVPPVLMHRMRVLEFTAPRPEDFDVLVRGILQDLADEHGCDLAHVPELPRELLGALRNGFRAGRVSARKLAAHVRDAVEVACQYEASAPRH